jgi:hypothetical protein
MLKEQGIECARRTVAKYREALKIAPANLSTSWTSTSWRERRRLDRVDHAASRPCASTPRRSARR